MLKRKKIIYVIVCTLLVLAMAVPSLAWFIDFIKLPTPSISASTEGTYFESGIGTAENPYILSSPIHLYNLAWLQYIGYFNMGTINNGQVQSYFKLKNDIDMDGMKIPPIGTTEHPFLGNFNGNGKVISNVTTGNAKSLLSERPSNSRFEVDDLLSEFGGNAQEAGAVIGFFGVIGNYNGVADNILSNESFDESSITVKNMGIYNYSLINASDATIIGFVAGYVDAKIENVLVNKCTLTVSSGANSIASITENLSDHALVGYCTDSHINEISIYTPDLGTFEDINNFAGFTVPTWGGSISMDDLYSKLSNSFDSGTKQNLTYRTSLVNDSISISSSYDFKVHNPNDYFSGIYSTGHDANNPYFGLAGGVMDTNVTYSASSETEDAYYISKGTSNYLTISGTYPNYTISNATSTNTAQLWIIPEGDEEGSIYTYYDNLVIYLNNNNGSLSLSTISTTSNWKRSPSNNTVYLKSSAYFIVYNSNGWTCDFMRSDAASPSSSASKINKLNIQVTYERMDYSQNATYIPLQMNGSYEPMNEEDDYNTGYITGGLYDALNNNGSLDIHNNDGDIRVGRYNKGNIDDGDSSYVYTIDKSAGSFIQIPTDTTNTAHQNYDYLDKLKKYADSVDNYLSYFDTSANAQGYLYGLHFMTGNIQNDRITVPKAIINQIEYTNYELPADCIDFQVPIPGFINFFAATYFPQNNCFFSLNHIIRDSDNKITAVKEISKIYDPSGKMAGGYIYKYTDGTYAKYQNGTYVTTSAPDESTLTFDMEWLKNPSGVDNWIQNTQDPETSPSSLKGYGYYFEIPIDPGEFALGSVSGEEKTGAYLLYLDVASAPQDIEAPDLVNRVTIEEVIYENSYFSVENVGVMNGNTYAEINNSTLSLTLPKNFGTSLGIERTDSTVNLTGDSSGIYLNSVGSALSVTGQTSNPTSVIIKRMTIIDTNITDGGTVVIAVITFNDINRNGTVDSGEVTMVDKDGTDISESVGLISSGTVTSFTMTTKPTGDSVNWDNITPTSPIALSCSYNSDSEYTAEYDYAGKTYALTSSSDVTITEVNLTADKVDIITVNGTSVTSSSVGSTIPGGG